MPNTDTGTNLRGRMTGIPPWLIRDIRERSQLNERTFNNVLNGTKNVEIRTLERIAEVMGVEVCQLLNEDISFFYDGTINPFNNKEYTVKPKLEKIQ